MSKRIFTVLLTLFVMAGLLTVFTIAANATDLTPDYYISGSPGAYDVGNSAEGTEIGVGYATFINALSACSSDWAGQPGTPVIRLGSADTPLSVNRGDGKLISATYTGAVNIEHTSSTYGLRVDKDAPVELHDFTLTNSLEGIGGEYNAVYVYTGGNLTIGSGTNIIVQDGGTYDANPNALYNDGTVTINGDAFLSIENKGRVITNYGTCTIGGNADDDIVLSTSPSSGTGILNFIGGILTIGTGATVSSNIGLANYNIATISGGILASSSTTVNNYASGTLYISRGTVRNISTNSTCNALVNNGTAFVSGGVITTDGTDCAIWTMYRLTLEGDCQVSAPNGTAVGSNTNTKANSEIIIRENASITGKTTGVEASAASGSGGSGPSTLTITGGSISGNSCAVKTSANTEISGGTLSASGPSITNSFALECSGGTTVNISGGEFIADSERYSAYGIYNKGATVNFSGGNVTATTTASTSDYAAYGIYNKENTSADISGGSITAKANVAVTNMKIYGLYNKNATSNITGGTISSEGLGNTASAVFDEVSASPKGVFISGTPVLKSASPHTVRLQKRTMDSGTLTYFGTSFHANANATVTVQGTYDEAAAAYVINCDNNLGAQACALPDEGYGSPRWTSDAARADTLSTASPAALSTLTAGANTSVYLEVKPVFTVTVTTDANGTASAGVSSAAAGDNITLSATPDADYRFKEWQVVSGGVTITDDQFIMPSSNVIVKAIFELKVYTATVNVLCNERYIVAPGTVQLKQGGSTYTAASAETGIYTVSVPSGTYAVWINNEDTGKTITINGAAAAVTVDYYSVIFSITNSGAAVGGSISATANGTTIVKNDYVLAGKTIVLTVNPSGAQTYTYLWTGNGMSGQTTQSITFPLTEYVYAVCNVTGSATYTVTLNTNGGTINSGNVTSYDYGTGATLPTDVTKEGNVFGGWYNNAGFIGSPVTAISTTEKGGLAFYAKWTANEYTITYNAESGSVSAADTEVTYDSADALLVPARTGYTFGGWYDETGGIGNQVTSAAGVPTGTVPGYVASGKWMLTDGKTVYAKWTVNTYTLTFDSNGGSPETGITVEYGDSLTLPTPTRANYTFNGWYESETGNNGSGTQFNAATMPDLGDNGTTKILYAKWTAKKAIAYKPAVEAFTYGDASAAYTVSYPSLTGFTVEYYVGSAWTAMPPTGARSYDIRITRAEDTIYASYASGTLDDHFVINPATLTVTVKPGVIITKAYDEDAAVDGVQSDWLIVNGLKNGETATAVGTWSYANADAGTGKPVNITEISIAYGTANSANYSYTPASLSTTGDITNASQAATAVVIDYIAETVSTITVMQYSTDGLTWSDCTANMAIASGWFGDDIYFRLKAKPNYDAGATQTLNIPARPATPAATGTDEIFFGQGNGSISGVSVAMEYQVGAGGSWQNVTGTELTGLTAGTYTIRVKVTGSNFKSLEQEIVLSNGPKLSVSFEENGGSAINNIADLSYNAIISAPTAPTKEGYTFAGWYKEAGCTNAWDFATDKVTTNINLYAKWTINQYTVVFDSNGGSTVSNQTVDYNTAATQPSAPTKTDYTFNGWYSDSGLLTRFNFATPVTGDITLYAKWTRNHGDSAGTVTQQPKTITVTETSSSLFSRSEGQISASANMNSAFANSVEVKVTDTQEGKAGFGFAAADEVYPFDISLYIKGTNEKTEPAVGYTVTISLPVPQKLLDKKDLLSVVHKSADGAVTMLASSLEQKNGAWYLVFEAMEFSPYALVVRSVGTYDESAGMPYYLDTNGSKVFIGFAVNGKYIAPEGIAVSVTQNGKSFTDVSGHWAAQYIGFVTEREIFLGTGSNTFSPNTGMTRAMFATVVGRLYERSYGEINAPNTHAFTDCDYSGYYGKYVDWAAKNDIIGGYGNGGFGPDDSITREQMAAILYRFANFLRVLPNDMNAALNYPDAGSISSYAKNAALYCQTTGVISGRTGGIFAPQETATRAEVAAIIQRFVESVIE